MNRDELYDQIKKLPLDKQITVFNYISTLISPQELAQAPPCPQAKT
jgi:hypothetical protein